MMRPRRLALLFLFNFGFPLNVPLAQEAPPASAPPDQTAPQPPQAVPQMPPVVVTATRMETPLQETAASVTVIDEEEIRQQQATTVAEALRSVPGLDIAQNGSRGTTTSVFTRGAESDQTLVLLDGVELNSVTLGAADFSNLTSENIDRIEVLRGGGGTLYGSQAIGGVINVLSKRGKGPLTTSISSEGGNGGTSRETLSFSGSQGLLGFSGAVANVDTSGFRLFNDGHRNFTSNLRLDLNLLPQGVLRGFFRYGDAKVGLFNNKNYLGVPDANARQRESFVLAKGEWEHAIGNAFSYRIAGAYVKDTQRYFDDPDRFDAFGSGISRIPTEMKIGEAQANYSWRDISITTVGFEYKDRSADVRSNFGGWRTEYLKGQHNVSYYLQERLRLLDERLFLTAGFRVDDNEDFGAHVTPSWSLVYLIPQTGTKLKGGFAEGFRAPTFNELFYPNFGNPNLGPEKSAEWNAGFEQSLGDPRFSLEATYFNRRVKGMIEAALVDPVNFIFQAQNQSRVDVQGVEVIPSFHLSSTLTVSGHFTYLDYMTKDGRLLRRPTKHGVVQLNYQTPVIANWDDLLNVNLSVKVIGDRDDIDPQKGTRTNPMFARTDLAVSYTIPTFGWTASRISFYGKIENMWDRRYQEVLGFRSPPFTYLAGVRLTF
jgi:vitamin B12 transporter